MSSWHSTTAFDYKHDGCEPPFGRMIRLFPFPNNSAPSLITQRPKNWTEVDSRCHNTRFPLPTLLNGKSVKLQEIHRKKYANLVFI